MLVKVHNGENCGPGSATDCYIQELKHVIATQKVEIAQLLERIKQASSDDTLQMQMQNLRLEMQRGFDQQLAAREKQESVLVSELEKESKARMSLESELCELRERLGAEGDADKSTKKANERLELANAEILHLREELQRVRDELQPLRLHARKLELTLEKHQGERCGPNSDGLGEDAGLLRTMVNELEMKIESLNTEICMGSRSNEVAIHELNQALQDERKRHEEQLRVASEREKYLMSQVELGEADMRRILRKEEQAFTKVERDVSMGDTYQQV